MAISLVASTRGLSLMPAYAKTCCPGVVRHALDSLRESELIPGPKASAEEIRELARLASASFGHAVGTCKMGVDKLAVVDPELRVHGIFGLRVADASVMPQIITGPGTNASTHMIAGRAAQLVLR